MKKIIKPIVIAAVTALALTGCAENREISEGAGSFIEESSAPTNSEVEKPDTSTTATSQTPNYPKPVESSSATSTATVESKPEEKPTESSSATTSTVEKPAASSSTTTASKPIEKPAATSSSTTTASKPIEKPIATSSSTTTASKPVEKPVHTHNYANATCEKPATCTTCGAVKGNALGHNYTSAACNKLATCTICGATKGEFANHNYKNGTCTVCGKNDPASELSPCERYGHDYYNDIYVDEDHIKCGRCGELHTHDWDVTYTTTEPKWCREMHDVLDCGFDVNLAAQYLGVNAGEAYKIYVDNLEAMDIPVISSSCTRDVEVWGTETYWHKECKCGHSIGSGNIHTINPMGEWRFIDGKNTCRNGFHNELGRHTHPTPYNFNTLYYDPNNIPQTVIDNHKIFWEYLDLCEVFEYVYEHNMPEDEARYWVGENDLFYEIYEKYAEYRNKGMSSNEDIHNCVLSDEFNEYVSSIDNIRAILIEWY